MFGDVTKSDVQREMRAVAEAVQKRGEELAALAATFDEMTEEEFEKTLGEQYAGPGTATQWMDYVRKAVTPRPNETWGFERAVFTALAQQQRETGKEVQQVAADQAAREEAGA